MPMKMFKKFSFLTLLVFFNTLSVFAQATDDGPEPPPPAPINQYVLIAAIIAIGFVFAYFSKKRSVQMNNDINL